MPKAVLAAVVLTAVAGLIDLPQLLRLWRVSRLDFNAAAIALAAVLLLGILHGILLATVASVILLLIRSARPHVAFLGRIPGTRIYSDSARHPENEPLAGVIAFRPEASLFYVNVEAVLEMVLDRVRQAPPPDLRLVICDLSECPFIDLSGAAMLGELHKELAARDVPLRIMGAHGYVREVLRAAEIADKVGGVERDVTVDDLLQGRAR